MVKLKSRYEIIGKTDHDCLPAELADAICENDQFVIKNDTSLKKEELAFNADGQPATYLSEKIPLHNPDGSIAGLLGISFDITQRVEYENELTHAKELAEVASRAKSEFIMNMSHDIRTPCTGIVGYSKILMDQETDPDKHQQLETIHGSAAKLLSFLNKIIELSRIEENDLPRQNIVFNIHDIINDLDQLFSALMQNKKLKLTKTIDPAHPKYLFGNQYALHRVLLNLISNAIKFTHEGSIDVHLELVSQTGEQIVSRLTISDTGIGISEEDKEKIFEKFTRLSSAYKGIYEGTGIGLYISKKFIDELGGSIRVENNAEQGTSFICEIPYTISESQMVSPQRDNPFEMLKKLRLTHPRDGKQFCVLLVEDNVLAQRIAKTLLEDQNCQVTIAATGADALKQSQYPFDLIFMDIGLPDFDGITVAERIRHESALNAKTPILGLTAHIDKAYHEQLAAVGVNEILTKPISKKHIEILFPLLSKVAVEIA